MLLILNLRPVSFWWPFELLLPPPFGGIASPHRFKPSGRDKGFEVSVLVGGLSRKFFSQFLSWCSFAVLWIWAPLPGLLLPEVCGPGVRVLKGARKNSELWAEDQKIFGRKKLFKSCGKNTSQGVVRKPKPTLAIPIVRDRLTRTLKFQKNLCPSYRRDRELNGHPKNKPPNATNNTIGPSLVFRLDFPLFGSTSGLGS